MPEVEKNDILDELQEMKERMDSLYCESMKARTTHAPAQEKGADVWEPPVDIWETEDEWVVAADLPGIKERDLQVEVLDDRLTIRGRREAGTWGPGVRASRTERPRGDFSRTFQLPPQVQTDAIGAKLKHGILTITVPKKATLQASSHKIDIRWE